MNTTCSGKLYIVTQGEPIKSSSFSFSLIVTNDRGSTCCEGMVEETFVLWQCHIEREIISIDASVGCEEEKERVSGRAMRMCTILLNTRFFVILIVFLTLIVYSIGDYEVILAARYAHRSG